MQRFMRSCGLSCAASSRTGEFSKQKQSGTSVQGALPVGFVPSPFPTSPFSLRSICQLSVSPALFLSVKAKTAFPCLIASLRSASDAVKALLMTSKAPEAGKASISQVRN